MVRRLMRRERRRSFSRSRAELLLKRRARWRRKGCSSRTVTSTHGQLCNVSVSNRRDSSARVARATRRKRRSIVYWPVSLNSADEGRYVPALKCRAKFKRCYASSSLTSSFLTRRVASLCLTTLFLTLEWLCLKTQVSTSGQAKTQQALAGGA